MQRWEKVAKKVVNGATEVRNWPRIGLIKARGHSKFVVWGIHIIWQGWVAWNFPFTPKYNFLMLTKIYDRDTRHQSNVEKQCQFCYRNLSWMHRIISDENLPHLSNRHCRNVGRQPKRRCKVSKSLSKCNQNVKHLTSMQISSVGEILSIWWIAINTTPIGIATV